MKTIAKTAVATALVLAAAAQAAAFDLRDLLNKETISNAVEGVLTNSNITITDMTGTWKSSGSAVCFKSENFLAKAGGIAAAATIEAKLNPYYQQYGLNQATFVIQQDGSFTMTVKRINVSGTIVKNEADNNFQFSFNVLGRPVMSVTAYCEKSPGKLNIMFDASKLMSLVQMLAQFTNNSMANTAVSLLDNYEGLCVGFALDAQGGQISSGSGLGGLFDAIKGAAGKTQQQQPAQQQQQQQSDSGSGLGGLFDLLNGMTGGGSQQSQPARQPAQSTQKTTKPAQQTKSTKQTDSGQSGSSNPLLDLLRRGGR